MKAKWEWSGRVFSMLLVKQEVRKSVVTEEGMSRVR